MFISQIVVCGISQQYFFHQVLESPKKKVFLRESQFYKFHNGSIDANRMELMLGITYTATAAGTENQASR